MSFVVWSWHESTVKILAQAKYRLICSEGFDQQHGPSFDAVLFYVSGTPIYSGAA